MSSDEEPLPKIRRNHIVSGKTRIVESRPIGEIAMPLGPAQPPPAVLRP